MWKFKSLILTFLLCLVLISCAPATPSGILPTASQPATPTPVVITQTSTHSPTVASTPEGTWIKLTPDSGSPGTTVQVEGYLPSGLPKTELAPRDYATYASICWNGCQTGLEEDGLEVVWSRTDAGHFSFKFTVPPIPWLGSDGFHPLEAGDYSIDLINLDPTKVGCAPPSCPETPDASATFHLTQSATYPACKEPNCGSLVTNPPVAAPGETVQVSGWAPLVQFIGEPYGYNLVLEQQGNTVPDKIMYLAVQQSEAVVQATDGSLTASFQVPQISNDGSALTPGTYTLGLEAFLPNVKETFPTIVAPTPFEITAAPNWADLPHATPLWVQPASDELNSSLTADALDPKHLAYCAAGEIRLSQDAGQSWTSVPVNATRLPSPLDQLTAGDQSSSCVSVTLDSSHPDSLYAVFGLTDKVYGAPPIYFAGYFTTDLGKTWQLAPVSAIDVSDLTIYDSFGGFWKDGKTVQVLYYRQPAGNSQPEPLLVKQTLDGGITWTDATLACPAKGLCVRWGAAPGFVGVMGADMPQAVLVSPDGGRTWQDTGQSVNLRATGPNELVALSNTDVLLVAGGDRFPLRSSADGGVSWKVIALPATPTSQAGYYAGYPGLQIGSDGSLLSMLPDTGQWVSLFPPAQDWCQIAFTSPDKYPGLLKFAGTRVWWLSGSTLQPQSASQSDFVCRP
jgi:photosystem II stability/assembly factor-like uncharacterized protein